MTGTAVPSLDMPADWRDFWALTKPSVMRLVVFTALCGLLVAPGTLPPILSFTAILCIAVGAGAAGALNQWYESDIDALMKRTVNRPLPSGRMNRQAALHFGVGLAGFSIILMGLATNWAAAAMLAASIIFYVLVYTAWLKPRTPQNIVIGGAAGAFPPLIGWMAVTGNAAAPLPWLLFLLIFLWTPPHFWALALWARPDYANAGIPMLPVVAGDRTTRRHILFYTIPMSVVAIAPWPMDLAGKFYGLTAVIGSLWFFSLAVAVWRKNDIDDGGMKAEKRLFAYSILYLFFLFAALVADHWMLA